MKVGIGIQFTFRGLLAGFLGLATLGMVGNANAVVIDPGPVGTNCFVVNTDSCGNFDIDPTITGLSFDLVFDNMKHIEIFAGTDYQVGLFSGALFSLAQALGPIPYTVFLSDENGIEIPNTTLNGQQIVGGFSTIGLLSPVEDIIFHDVHFQFEILPGSTFNADLVISRSPLDGVGEHALIGEWQVPEPATLAIFGFGLAGLGVMRRRRKAAA